MQKSEEFRGKEIIRTHTVSKLSSESTATALVILSLVFISLRYFVLHSVIPIVAPGGKKSVTLQFMT